MNVFVYFAAAMRIWRVRVVACPAGIRWIEAIGVGMFLFIVSGGEQMLALLVCSKVSQGCREASVATLRPVTLALARWRRHAEKEQ